ncbi:hypothetical protein [Massilia sp. TWP1-3-3]|uniref:hypothetical protein n=1 Tax=Massilia sp. TWP1-3-3 TaxID=2804573 RepID=UPI003CEA7886
MAVHFITGSPNALLKKFNDAIDQDEPKGKITTWQKHAQGGTTYYTHVAPQWHKKAFFRAKSAEGKLTFNIIKPEGSNVTTDVYAYYHGHLIETFLRHFDDSFTEGKATAGVESPDKVS